MPLPPFAKKTETGVEFNWQESVHGIELNERGKLPYAIVTLNRRTSNFLVDAKLFTKKMKGKKTAEYHNRSFFDTESEALKGIEIEKKKIESLLKDVWAADFVLPVLGSEDALEFVSKGISTCSRCGKKFTSEKKYHRLCDECGAAR